MANRRVWSALSSDYRTRLMRSGITRETYEAGTSLKKARGHSETPERPADAIRQPSRYQKYRLKMKGLQQQVLDRKAALYGDRFKYHDERARRYVFTGDPLNDVKAPGVVKMTLMLTMTDDELEDETYQQALRDRDDPSGDDDWRFLFYH